MNAAVKRIGPRVGINAGTLRGWCKQADIDVGRSPGTATADNRTGPRVGAGVKELRGANEILLAASSFLARELDTRLRW